MSFLSEVVDADAYSAFVELYCYQKALLLEDKILIVGYRWKACRYPSQLDSHIWISLVTD